MAIYHGDLFADWQGDLLIGFLAGAQVRRVRVSASGVQQETLLAEDGRRIRDVRVASDGAVYLLTDDDNGALLRVRPAG
jgi:glucose/arabinose dehydrogenase